MSIETEEQFKEFVEVTIPCALFSISKNDIDETGAKCEDRALLYILSRHPEVLKFKSLSWFVDTFINKNEY